MNIIPTMTVHQPVPTPVTPPAPLPITFPYPLSYEFQVVEHVDENDKIIKVALQVKINQHDQYGNVYISGTWNDVPRVKIKF